MLYDEFPDQLLTCQNHVSDAYENPYTAERASWYGVGGIPDVRIDGVATIIGAGSCLGAYEAYRAAFLSRMDQTGWVSPVSITGTFSQVGSNLSVTASFRLVDPVVLTDLHAFLVVLENGIVYGPDNRHVTRAGYHAPIALQNVGDIVQINRSFPIAGWNMNNVEVIAFVQKYAGDKAIHQGRRLPAVADFSAYMPNALLSIPAGNGTAEFTGTVMNISALSDNLTISLNDTFGWPTAFKLEGEPDFHTDPSIVNLAPDEEITLYLQVTTDADVRIGVGGLQIASQNTGTEMALVARVFNASPAVLVVDDDFTRNDEVMVLAALDVAGYLYDHWDVQFGHGGFTPTPAEMDRYDVVLWHCGWRTTDLITALDAQNLMAYMDTGKGLILSSQDALAGNMPALFLSDYLGVASWTNNVGALSLTGVGSDPISDGMNFTLHYPQPSTNRPDNVVPNGIGTVILYSEDNERVALRADNGTARSVFFAFSLNATDPAAPDPSNPATLLARAIDWVYQPEGQSVSLPDPDLAARIHGIAPNPFVPAGGGGIQLRIDGRASDGPMSLDLLDVTGRKLRNLLEGALPAGAHTIAWDGRDARGRELPAGTYFMRLNTAGGSHAAPLIVVR